MMFKSLLKSLADRFGRRYGYDVTYLHAVTETSPTAALKLTLTQGIASHRRGIPPEPWFAARIRAVLAEDCGPCTQLVVNMALEAGVAPERAQAVITRDLAALPGDTALTVRFADLVLRRDVAADDLREEIRQRWGQDGLISLSLVISAARLYPTFKYVLGYGAACQRVRVNEASLIPEGVGGVYS